MSSGRLVAGIVGAAVVAAAWNAGNAVSPPPRDALLLDGRFTPAVSRDAGRADSAPAATLIDLYGNEVERAVTDYRIDPRGDIYERHSPRTALPRLTSPIG